MHLGEAFGMGGAEQRPRRRGAPRWGLLAAAAAVASAHSIRRERMPYVRLVAWGDRSDSLRAWGCWTGRSPSSRASRTSARWPGRSRAGWPSRARTLAFTYQGERIESSVRELAASVGSDVCIECDVSSDESIDRAFAELVERARRARPDGPLDRVRAGPRPRRPLHRHRARRLPPRARHQRLLAGRDDAARRAADGGARRRLRS